MLTLPNDLSKRWKDLISRPEYEMDSGSSNGDYTLTSQVLKYVKQNILTIIEALNAEGYQYIAARTKGSLWLSPIGLRHAAVGESVLDPPEENVLSIIEEIESEVGKLPLVLRVWLQDIGGVNLMGDLPNVNHYRLGPMNTSGKLILPDPLLMPCATVLLQMNRAGSQFIDLWPDALAKAGMSSSEGIICLATNTIDPVLRGDTEGRTFVEYLRDSLTFAGFPGWKGHRNPPQILRDIAERLYII